EFDQKKIFDQNDDLLKAVLTNIATFASDVSGGLGTLVEFLNLTKIYLQAIADPIALILIPAIDQLIEAIEDLKNIGFGTLTVWPWEVGKVESGIDSTKALEALQTLIVALNQVNPDNLKWNPKTNQFQTIEVLGDRDELQQQGAGFLETQPFGFSAFEQISINDDGEVVQAKNLDKTFINNTLNTIYNYLNPKEWEEGDDATKRFINTLNESFQIRTLTPSQFVSEVNSSFDDQNDPARPIGTGDYVAFVGFFAFPTHHALRDMINALLKFFANFLQGIPDLLDDKVSDIELGHPLVISGLETDLSNQSLSLFTSSALQEKFYTLDNTSMRDLSPITEEKVFTPDNNTHNGVTIPMLEEGMLIQQGHVFNDFTAEVVRHVEIRVKDGQVISNKVKVRKVRGNIKHNTSSPMQQINVPPIIALDGKQLDSFGILKTGQGIQGAKNLLNFPMFAPTNPDVPQLQPSLKFKATMQSGSLILRTVLPVNDELIKYNSLGSAQDDPLTVTDVYTDQNLIGKLSFQVMMENFVEDLTIGAPITHNFLVTPSSSDIDIPVNPFDRLAWSLYPGMGSAPCIR
ncbi:MAG: hypothetical protein ACPGCR_04035, partial [Acholeplasmataceae bacterium]